MGRIIPRLTSAKANCCRFAPRTGPALVTSKSELFRARSLLRGSHLDVLSASWRCAPSGLILDDGQLEPDHRTAVLLFGGRRILGVAQQRAILRLDSWRTSHPDHRGLSSGF